MRLPNRKPGKYTFATFDPQMTADKFQALQQKLARLKQALPQAIKDTQTYGENGDFSENAEYQIAKGRLRGMNKTIAEIQHQLDRAIIIDSPADTSTVQIGHSVTININNTEKTFKILGSTETNPSAGIISYTSPVGAALLGHQVGDQVKVELGEKVVEYTIVKISLQ